MKILFVYPKYPDTYWSFSGVLDYIGKKAIYPPLGLLTIASMVPKEWEKKLVDKNITNLEDKDIEWADMVFISAMIVQKEDTIAVIEQCNLVGKKIVVGGPLFSSMLKDFETMNIDHLVLDEGEITLPLFLKDLEEGVPKHMYRSSERPDITHTPIPLWSLINVKDYYGMMLQFSRGCPFNCEFCDIVVMNGRTPRTKTTVQVIDEIQAVYNLGFTGCFFIVDDNFIGNKIKVKEVLRELIIWQRNHNFPFEFLTEASLNLADDNELLDLMRDANFKSVFLGIETPSIASLKECGKFQNTKKDLVESVKTIQRHGIKVMGGFIVGFDSDTEEIFDAQIEFIQRTGITTAMVGMLGALPNTRLWDRLEKEGRLVKDMTGDNTDGSLNFIPKMGTEKLLAGYARVLSTIYSPEYYYKRIYNLMNNYVPTHNKKEFVSKPQWMSFFKSIQYIGIASPNRERYWKLFWDILLTKPHDIALAIEQAVYGEHFMKVTQKVLKSLQSIKVVQAAPSLIKVESNGQTSMVKEEIF